MEYVIVCAAALVVSGLTLFSGFGLGTLLLPLFAILFPVEVAVAATAVVHFLNNLFKLCLVGRFADKGVVLRFGIPAMVAAPAGAWLLLQLAGMEPLASYTAAGRELEIMPVKLIVAILIVVFALVEILPRFAGLSFDRRYLPLGGVASGFFGGLSGHQGAMRSAFLIKCGLSREGFIATGVVIASLVDISRISVYAPGLMAITAANMPLILSAAASAFIGAFLGKKLIPRVTYRSIQLLVSLLLLIIAAGLGTGVI